MGMRLKHYYCYYDKRHNNNDNDNDDVAGIYDDCAANLLATWPKVFVVVFYFCHFVPLHFMIYVYDIAAIWIYIARPCISCRNVVGVCHAP